jgi:hypothetical protein
MPAKTQIVNFLGEKALVLPALLDASITGNERAKYVLSLLQLAVGHAEGPQGMVVPSLQADRKACGITDASFDRSIERSEATGRAAITSPAPGGSWQFSTRP